MVSVFGCGWKLTRSCTREDTAAQAERQGGQAHPQLRPASPLRHLGRRFRQARAPVDSPQVAAAGDALQVRIAGHLAVKVCEQEVLRGRGRPVCCLEYCAAAGAHITSNSWGGQARGARSEVPLCTPVRPARRLRASRSSPGAAGARRLRSGLAGECR